MAGKTFSEYERDGWDRNAEAYSDVVLPATRQVFAPLLDGLGDLSGKHVLEVASGTGHLAQAAVARGARLTGIDAAPAMVDLASRRLPDGDFRIGDGEDLSFPDASFDVVICAFGLLHMADPGRAMKEAARVLKPGGRYGFTVWQDPARGGLFVGTVFKVLGENADMNVDLPAAPPMFLLSDPEEHAPLLAAAGFGGIESREVPVLWPATGALTFLDFVEKGAVRARLIFDRQTGETQRRIRGALVAEMEPFLHQEILGIASPAVLVTATKQ